VRPVRILIIPLIVLLAASLFAACGSASAPSAPAGSISSGEAAAHIGERETFCGLVVDTFYAIESKGKPTFLNFDKAYPNHTFVVLIWDSDRGNFPANPESYYKGKEVCATGLNKGKPEIVARDGDQLEIQR